MSKLRPTEALHPDFTCTIVLKIFIENVTLLVGFHCCYFNIMRQTFIKHTLLYRIINYNKF